MINKFECCPECDEQWKGDDIYHYFLNQRDNPNSEQHEFYKNMTDEEIYKSATCYGYTHENPSHFTNLIGVQLSHDHPNHYDGVSYWMCPGCKLTWNRFTNKLEKIL